MISRQLSIATILCHPVSRFLREFKERNGSIGKQWRKCYGQTYTENRACWRVDDLTEFLGCRDNPAINRQTLMLSSSSCSQTVIAPEQGEVLLQSALYAMENFTFIGIQEFPSISRSLLPGNINDTETGSASQISVENIARDNHISEELYREIARANYLDMRLYYSALRVLTARAGWWGVGGREVLAEVEYPTDLIGVYDEMTEREREREREREIEREREREKERKTERERERQKERGRERNLFYLVIDVSFPRQGGGHFYQVAIYTMNPENNFSGKTTFQFFSFFHVSELTNLRLNLVCLRRKTNPILNYDLG
eukprot:sb/3467003/